MRVGLKRLLPAYQRDNGNCWTGHRPTSWAVGDNHGSAELSLFPMQTVYSNRARRGITLAFVVHIVGEQKAASSSLPQAAKLGTQLRGKRWVTRAANSDNSHHASRGCPLAIYFPRVHPRPAKGNAASDEPPSRQNRSRRGAQP